MNTLAMESPVGELTLVSDADALVGCYFENYDLSRLDLPKRSASDNVLDRARRQLDEFFAGRRKAFDLPLAPRGTPFQQSVWRALQTIPFGKTVSYGHIANQIKRPAAVRAVGAANGRNPICIIIPCHRVIGANGSLTGFGGGLERKEILLGHERGEAPLL
ncbi:MAG: methylated-DNA--[protein]-cysteine S-methyltransferase [Hyphomonadaceae bacterium]